MPKVEEAKTSKKYIHPYRNLMRGLTLEQMDLYHVFFPFVTIYNIQKYRPLEEFKNADNPDFIFHVNISDRIIIWHNTLDVIDLEKNKFCWNNSTASYRIIGGVDDEILCRAIAMCLRKNLKAIVHAGNTYDVGAEWTFPTKGIALKVKRECLKHKGQPYQK